MDFGLAISIAKGSLEDCRIRDAIQLDLASDGFAVAPNWLNGIHAPSRTKLGGLDCEITDICTHIDHRRVGGQANVSSGEIGIENHCLINYAQVGCPGPDKVFGAVSQL